ncbi:MAG: PAS domain-containing protein, partial [Allosphingosinicella sp.]
MLAAAAASAALLLWALDNPVFAAAFFAGVLAVGLPLLFVGRAAAAAPEALASGPDLGLLRAGLDASTDALAVTDASGALLAANGRYESWFGIRPPLDLPFAETLRGALAAASRDGQAEAQGLESGDLLLSAYVRSAGHGEGALLWRFARTNEEDAAASARQLLNGEIGRRLARTGLMAALTAADGRILEANAAFHGRAGGEAEIAPGTPLVD